MQITTTPQLPPITTLQLVIGRMSHDQISEIKVSPIMNSEEEIEDFQCQASQYEWSLQASQECQLFQCPVSLRFASPLLSEELFSKVEKSVPENTRPNTKWAVTTWQEWVVEWME